MIERKLVGTRMKEFLIQKYISESLQKVGYSDTKVQKTPLGEKIILYASRPGLIVGRKGLNIKNLTKSLKNKFKLENPQIEINEISKPDLDPQIVAEKIQSTLERFGSKRFKGIGHKTMEDVMRSGALGCEILISGKIPSTRAKRWRFYQGYLKKSGDVAVSEVKCAYTDALLKSGVVGIQVRIMLPDTVLPDKVEMKKIEIIEEVNDDVPKTGTKPKKDAPKKSINKVGKVVKEESSEDLKEDKSVKVEDSVQEKTVESSKKE